VRGGGSRIVKHHKTDHENTKGKKTRKVERFDGLVISLRIASTVIPTKAGIQEKQALPDPGWSSSSTRCGAGVTALMIFCETMRILFFVLYSFRAFAVII